MTEEAATRSTAKYHRLFPTGKRCRIVRLYAAMVFCAVIFACIMIFMASPKTNGAAATRFRFLGRDPGATIPFAKHANARPQPLLVAPLDTVTSESCATSGFSGVVRIPAVRKGLNNQRMRIIQDIVVARMLGMAVELPKIVRTRIDCGYRVGCYKNYDSFVPFENVFNYAAVVKRLEELDICVVESTLNFTEIPVVAGEGTCCVWCVSAARACCYWFTFDLLASLLQVWHGRWTHLQYRISALERTNSMGMCGRLVPKRTAAPSS